MVEAHSGAVPDNQAHKRYVAEAEFALSRLRVSREAGDAARSDHWHRAWSSAQAAAEAEAAEAGAGARLLRRKNPPALRPLPDEVPPLATAALPAVPSTCPDVSSPSPSDEP